MHLRSLGLLVCLFLCAVGCGKQEAEDTSGGGAPDVGTATSAKTDERGSPAAQPGVTTTVKLLDPGAEPRTPLRYQYRAGEKQRMVIELKMAMAMQSAAMQQPETQMPVTRMTMAIDCKEVTADGDLRYEFLLEEIEVLPAIGADSTMVARMQQQMSAMEGMSGSAVVTPRGVARNVDVKVPAGVDAQAKQFLDNMKQSMSQMSAPLPEEPVGKGASWRVTMPIVTPMVALTQVATYTLTDIQGEKVAFGVTIEQSAAPQQVRAPGAPPGTSVSLESLNSSGEGTVELALSNSLVPISTMNMTTTSVVVANNQRMKMTMRMEMKLHP